MEERNPYLEAVEATTEEEAMRHFHRLLLDIANAEPMLHSYHAREQVVANLCYVAGYYGPETQERVGRLYSWRSPYRTQAR